MPVNVLHIAKDFDLVSGVTRFVSTLLNLFNDDKEYKLHLIANRGDAIQSTLDSGFSIKEIPFEVGLKGLPGYLSVKRKIEKYCVENKIDIIHTHHRFPELIASQISKRNKIKTITTAHSIVSGFKAFSFKSDKIIAVSKYVAGFLKEKFKVRDERIIVMNNCIVNNFENYVEPDLSIIAEGKKTKIVLLYAGRFSKDKGTDILLKAFELIKDKYEVELWLLGMNYDLNLHSIKDNSIKILPPVVDVKNIYSKADIFILPSRVDPFPYFMLESGLFKKPFIGSRTGGIAEFIEDSVDGFLANPGDVIDLERKIEFVINNLSESKKASEKLNKKVNEKCNCEKYVLSLKNIYKELLSN